MNRPPLVLTGTLTEADHKSHIEIPFDVPEGVTRLTLRLATAPIRARGALYDNMICLSLWGPGGPRGALHNNPTAEFEIEASRATPGLLPGPIEPGTWRAGLDVFRLLGPDPVTWRIEVELCFTALEPAALPHLRRPRPRGPGWFRGDLHSHTLHSDGSWDVPELVGWARARELDFLALTDHNTVSGHAQALSLASDDLLVFGGMEMTTHWGHAVTHGAGWHEWRGADMARLAAQAMAKGASFTIAHPMAPGDDQGCTGCRWTFAEMMPGPALQVEIWNGGPWSDYNEEGLALFRRWLAQGHRLVATAGSDIHGPEGGVGPIGFNHVEARSLTEADILSAVARGRNYLSSGPRLILGAGDVPMGGTAPGEAVFHLHWQTGPAAARLILTDARGPLCDRAVEPDLQGGMDWQGAPEGFVMAELRDRRDQVLAITNPIFIG